MRKDKNLLSRDVLQMLRSTGMQIKERRKSRYITMEKLCERTFISRVTLALIEKGSPNVSIGLYFEVLCALGFGHYLWELANDRPGHSRNKTSMSTYLMNRKPDA